MQQLENRVIIQICK